MSAKQEKDLASTPGFFTAPNILTLSRVVLGFGIYYLLTTGSPLLWLVVALAIVSEVSDVLDGALARKMGLSSGLGQALDPLCDSLYRLTVFMAFAAAGWMPLWLVFPFLFRDIIVSYARIMAASRGVSIGARLSGKIKAVIQGVVQIAVVLAHIFGLADTVTLALVGIAAAMTLYSLFDYVQGFASAR
ncbi:MAG: CDP-diacylglycerol--glycerol-3-phosphate 3-phosphatidyltransferase [Robiginitomaculum sp.]|nr:MAG: CDP-diacylglycerol--glycerol-3-phosphate 3-phosphatidyltransferase [Robiginitomaculum sp.]